MAIAIFGNSLDPYIMGYSTCEEIQPEEVTAAINPPLLIPDYLIFFNNKIICPSVQSVVDPT